MVEQQEAGGWRPVVMDFGLARDAADSNRLTQSGSLLGTPHYMPPEQARGEIHRIDRRSDVYSLGAVLYELLTGRPPFGGRSVPDILLKILETDPAPPRCHAPDVPEDLEIITLKCLQKEPELRYESAWALAEDLRRHLEGERIVGRATNPIHRAIRWMRKRPELIALGTITLIGLLSCAGFWLRTHRRAQEQAAQAQLLEQLGVAESLGQDVKEMELFMRVSHMMPLHDVTNDKAMVRKRMREIERQLAHLPKKWHGQVEYALGRGHMALDEYSLALLHLGAAWDKGYRGPGVNDALGRAYGGQFKLELAESERSSDAQYRQQERAQLESKLLAPALSHLRLASSGRLESPEYVEGLLALYARRYTVAAQRAEAAILQHPWQYEAQVLAGDVYSALGSQSFALGRAEEARRYFEQALSRYQAAANLARSDGSIYESEANVLAKLIENIVLQGGDPRAAYEQGLRVCDLAIRTEPSSIRAYESKLHLYERWGNYLYLRGEDIQEVALAAAKVLKYAAQVGDVDAAAYDAVGALYAYHAAYDASRGRNPLPSLGAARELFQRAISKNPGLAWAWNDWAGIEVASASWLARNGSHYSIVVQRLGESEKMLRRAIEIDPTYLAGFENLIDIYANLAVFAMSSGIGDPNDYMQRAALIERKAMKFIHQDFLLSNNLALVHLAKAQYRYLNNQDSGQALYDVFRNTDQTLKLKADYEGAYQSRAEAHLIAARAALDRGANVSEEIAQGLKALAEKSQHSPSDARDETLRARLLLTSARWLVRQGKPASKTWRESAAAAARALKSDATNPDARLGRAEILRYQLELKGAPASLSRRLLKQGAAAAEQVLEQQPWNMFAQAARASFYVLRGRATKDPGQRRLLQDMGQSLLTELLNRNPLLLSSYQSLLPTAPCLAGR